MEHCDTSLPFHVIQPHDDKRREVHPQEGLSQKERGTQDGARSSALTQAVPPPPRLKKWNGKADD